MVPAHDGILGGCKEQWERMRCTGKERSPGSIAKCKTQGAEEDKWYATFHIRSRGNNSSN